MQSPDAIQRVSVFRPVEYQMGPSAQPEVSESCLNRYRMQIDPQFFDEQRASFQLRAPGLGVVCSNNMFIEASFTIRAPARWNFATASQALFAPQPRQDIEAPGNDAAAEVLTLAYSPKICFGGGDAMAGALSNVQLVCNGAALSNSRQRTYTNALDRVWFGKDVFQRRFSCCGGKCDAYDSVCVSGRTNAANLATINGFTADSGIEKRCQNLLACTTTIDASGSATQYDPRTVRIRWPVRACGVLSPVGPFDEMADSCPYKSSCLAIPHFNTISLDFLFAGLKECLFRNLTARLPAGGNTLTGGGVLGGFVVALDTATPPTLHAEYLRLGMWNQIPASISIPAFKIAVHQPTKTVKTQNTVDIVRELTRANVNKQLSPALPAVGFDRTNGILSRCAPFDGDRYLEAEYQITSAQVASYLVFVMQKTSDMYVLGGDALEDSVGKQIDNWDYHRGALAAGSNTTQNAGLQNYFLARNTNSCASIQQISLEIMSSVGSYTYSTENYPYIRGRHELFRDVLRHTCPGYLDGDINTWRKHCSIVILSSSDFVRGLTTSGSSFPVQYSVKVKYASEREYISGAGAAAFGAAVTGTAVLRDCIAGEPVMLEIFDKAELRLSPSSGVVSSMNISHSTALDLVSRGGAQQ